MVEAIEHSYNVSVVEQLVERSRTNPDAYPISQVAKLINRTAEGDMVGHRLRRGEISSIDQLSLPTNPAAVRIAKYEGGFQTSITWRFDNGSRRTRYIGLTLPGWSHGAELYQALDDKVATTDISSMTEEQKFQFIAFVSIAVGTTHAFADGNGRADRGVVDFLLRRDLGRHLDQEAVAKRKRELNDIKKGASYRLLPGKYNPTEVDEMMKEKGLGYFEVLLPYTQNYLRDELPEFLRAYADSIKNFIEHFAPPNSSELPFKDINHQVQRLAQFYREISVA